MKKNARFCRLALLRTIITVLLAIVALSGHSQTTDTLSIGMEMKLQNVISTNVFMMHKETTPMKGLPADTASFHLYEVSGILCALGKTDKESTYFVSLDLNGDKDFTNDYRYSFTRQGTSSSVALAAAIQRN